MKIWLLWLLMLAFVEKKKLNNLLSRQTAPSVKCRLEFSHVQFHDVSMPGDVTVR